MNAHFVAREIEFDIAKHSQIFLTDSRAEKIQLIDFNRKKNKQKKACITRSYAQF